jgi:hypothetical protein
LKLYNLGPLSGNRNFVPPRLGESTYTEEEKLAPSQVADDESRRKRSALLASRLRAGVPEELWTDDSTIEAQSDVLIVHAPEAVHERIDAALKNLLAERITVSIQFMLLAMDERGIASLPAALGRDARIAAEELFQPRPLTTQEMNALLDPGIARVETAPSIACFHEQVSHVMVIQQHAIIADARKSEREGGRLEPVPRILNMGLVVQVLAAVTEDKKTVGLELSAQWGDVKKPIQRVEAEGLTVEVPEVSLRSADAKLEARSGTWMLAGRFPGRHWAEPRETLLWLVKAEVPEE